MKTKISRKKGKYICLIIIKKIKKNGKDKVFKIKILNCYAGIGGNRKLWKNVTVTAVELDPNIAKIYQDFFPNDKVIVADAHNYLLEHHKEFDFIWSSPPCPSHSDIRRMGVDIGRTKAIYPDMKLYEEIIFLKHFFKGLWVVENVKSYYNPLIKPAECGRHYFWANFIITNKNVKPGKIKEGNQEVWKKLCGFDISEYGICDKRKIYRNCVKPELGLHVFNCAFKTKQKTLTEESQCTN